MPEISIKRGFVDTEKGQIHYRVAGSGAPLVLLHPSPFNSRRFEPLIPNLARHRRVFAIDTPGYGLSYRPATQPTMEDYADAVAAAIAGLGYERAPLYGDLTGALIALETAIRHPRRVSALALGVIPYYAKNADEFEPFQKRVYPVGFQLGPLAADGGHFAKLFHNIIDAGLHKSTPEQVITPEQVNEWVIDRMDMRDSAIWGFEAAFHWKREAELRSLNCPILMAATESHGNELRIARARALLPMFELRQGPKSFLIEEVRDFLGEAIPAFLAERGV